MKFSQYAYEKDKKELINFLIENNIDINNVDLDYLLTEDWNKWKKGLKRGLATGALVGASMLGGAGALSSNAGDTPTVKPYSADYVSVYKKGSPTGNNSLGKQISSYTSSRESVVKIIENGIRKEMKRDSLVEIISSKNLADGSEEMVIQFNGNVSAFSQKHAEQQVKIIISEICKKNGFSLEGFQTDFDQTKITPASRSTIDHVRENNERGEFEVSLKFKIKVENKGNKI